MQFKTGDSKTLKISAFHLSYIKLKAFQVGNSGMGVVSVGYGTLDLTNVQANINLTQHGRKVNVYSGTLDKLLRHQRLIENDYPHSTNFELGYAERLQNSFPTGNTAICYSRIDFLTMLNLGSSDLLELDITVKTGTFDLTSSNQTLSYLELEPIAGIGLQTGIPKIDVYNVNAASDSFSEPLGSSIVNLTYHNTDKSFTAATEVFNSVQVQSDKLSQIYDFADMTNIRRNLVADFALESDLDQNFPIHVGAKLNNLKLDISFNSAQITAGKNYIVATRMLVPKRLAQAFAFRANKHQAEEAARIV